MRETGRQGGLACFLDTLLNAWNAEFPRGISIVFLGTDGCGKTSAARMLKQQFSGTYPMDQTMHLHWKPNVLKWWKGNGGDQTPLNPEPHLQPPRSQVVSLVYFAIHLFEFIVGWWIKIYPSLLKNRMILIDRYYYDFFVDLKRYRLKLPQWLLWVGFVFVPKPDLVFCLDADPEILYERKQEVPLNECRRQREAYRQLTEKHLPNGYVVDASQSLDKMADDVELITRAHLMERLMRRVCK